MKTRVFLLVLFLAASLQAEVFIYKNSIKYSLTGGGTSKVSAKGWTIIDNTGQITQVLAYPAQKKYTIMPMESVVFTYVDGGDGRRYATFVQHDQWYDGNGHLHLDTGGAKGMTTLQPVNGTAWEIPKSYTWSGRSLYPADSSGAMRFEESSGRFTFDKKWTDTCNGEGDTLTAAAERLAASLQEQGYESF
jgi:hypothetical protein